MREHVWPGLASVSFRSRAPRLRTARSRQVSGLSVVAADRDRQPRRSRADAGATDAARSIAGPVAALRFELPDRPDFDAAFARRRNLRRDLDRLVVIGGVDQIETGELFLGLRKRPIGDRDAAVADANGLGGLNRKQRLGGEQQALLAAGRRRC